MERVEKKNTDRERAAILIVAYKEPRRFQRLLDSVSGACYDGDRVDLIISIDKSDRMDVVRLAEAFGWEHGDKIIRTFRRGRGCEDIYYPAEIIWTSMMPCSFWRMI